MRTKSFRNKIILPIAVVFIALTAALTVYTSVRFMSHCHDMIDGKNVTDANALEAYINNCRTFSRAAAVAMTYKPEVVKDIVNRDREALLKFLLPMCELYHVNYFTVTDESGIVILRTYQPQSYGDDISYQRNIQDALRGEIITTFESGTHIRVAVRSGAPIYDAAGKLIGIVSAGVRFDSDELVDGLKEVFKSEVTVFLGDTRIATTIVKDGKRVNGTKMPPDVAKVVLEKKSIFADRIDIFDETYKAVYVPLINPDSAAFATFFIGAPMNEHMNETVRVVINIVIISLVGLFVAILVLYFVIATITKPLIVLSKSIDDIERGDLDGSVDIEGDDEIGRIGRSLQKCMGTVRELTNAINMILSENKKGNPCTIDTNAFCGSYKLLAERISELSDVSAKDKLTGLANRRMFDARLELEWNRSMRDGSQLSLLMIDIDHFKSYNDRYGHRQGDSALQVAAAVLTQSINRGVDMAARWGGEEFAVLLPNTDSYGAMTVAMKIRAAIEETRVPCISGGNPKNITVSIGVYTCVPTIGNTIESLVSKADDALYLAKRGGRNQVCTMSPQGGSSDDVCPVRQD